MLRSHGNPLPKEPRCCSSAPPAAGPHSVRAPPVAFRVLCGFVTGVQGKFHSSMKFYTFQRINTVLFGLHSVVLRLKVFGVYKVFEEFFDQVC